MSLMSLSDPLVVAKPADSIMSLSSSQPEEQAPSVRRYCAALFLTCGSTKLPLLLHVPQPNRLV